MDVLMTAGAGDRDDEPGESADDGRPHDAAGERAPGAGPNATGGGSPDADPNALLLREPELPPPDAVPPPSAGPVPLVLPAPTVREIAPAEGLVFCETRVTLRGEHLHRESIIRFDGLIAMTVGAAPPRELTVKTPPRDRPGAVEVSIQNPGAPLVALAGAFRYLSLPAPEITTLAPRRGAAKGGIEISVTGQRFVEGCVVIVGGKRAKTVFLDARTLEAIAPPGTPGAMVDVAVENPDGKRAVEPRGFLYESQ